MVNKILGYTLSIIGIGVIAVGSMPKLGASMGLPASLGENMYVLGAGLLISAAGIFILTRSSSSKQHAEVPIYHEDKIVGYRRMKK